MSRCDYYDGEDSVPDGLWAHRFWQATETKKGQARLREFAAILDAMPEKRLIADELQTPGGEVCFVGAICKARNVPMPTGDCDIRDTAEAGQRAGIPWTLAWEMARMNDETWGRMTPEERWQAARTWIQTTLEKAARA